MQVRIIFGLLSIVFLLQACKTKQPIRPKEYYDEIESSSPISTINLPLKISQQELEKSINQELGQSLYVDDDMRGDGLKIRATKQSPITIEVDGQQIKYHVPIDLWVQKDLAITTVEGEGTLSIDLTTNFNIQPDWNFQTKTALSNHQWTKPPVVRTPLGNLNVTTIADEFIHQIKGEITSTIDKQLNELFDLKKEMGKAWNEMQQPFLLSEEQASFLLFNPKKIGMTPLKTMDGAIQSVIVVSAQPQLVFGEIMSNQTAIELPDFQTITTVENDDFEIKMSSAIPFSEAEKIARENMLNESYSFKGKTVTVEEVELYGQGNKLVVKTNLSGDYTGDVYLIGKPEYNARKNKIELEDVEFDFSSKKRLLRTASWLFKGTFKRRIQDELNFNLHENLNGTKELIQRELKNYELSKGVNLRGNLNNLDVSKVYIGADAIHVQVGLDGNINLEVNGFGKW